MKAVGTTAEVVDRTVKLDTADSTVKTEDTAVTVDDVDVDDTATAGGCLHTEAHTASEISMNHS